MRTGTTSEFQVRSIVDPLMNTTVATTESDADSRPAVRAATAERAVFWRPIRSLAERELVRFFRQRTRLIGALVQPVLFWVLFGAGLHGSFRPPEWAPASMTYQEYFFPGIAVLIVMFTAIFSTISIIEDRREGFLQGVLVAPISRWSLVFGKLTGGTILAVLQAALFVALGPALSALGLAPVIEIPWTISNALSTMAFLTLLAFALTALGYVIAWPMDSTQGFHAIMSVFLMPMWLLSGAFFPTGGTGWLGMLMAWNPLSYGVAGLRQIMFAGKGISENSDLPSLTTCWLVTVLFAAVCITVAGWQTRRKTSPDIR